VTGSRYRTYKILFLDIFVWNKNKNRHKNKIYAGLGKGTAADYDRWSCILAGAEAEFMNVQFL
jgi:hypothetical protein